MEAVAITMLEQLGISSVVAGLLYLLVSREAYHRKEKRDCQINELKEENKALKEEFKENKEHHRSFEKEIYEKLNETLGILNRLQGYMDGKYDKGK